MIGFLWVAPGLGQAGGGGFPDRRGAAIPPLYPIGFPGLVEGIRAPPAKRHGRYCGEGNEYTELKHADSYKFGRQSHQPSPKLPNRYLRGRDFSQLNLVSVIFY